SSRAFQLVEVAGKRAVQINGHAVKLTRDHRDGRPYRRRHESPRPNAFYYSGHPWLTATRQELLGVSLIRQANSTYSWRKYRISFIDSKYLDVCKNTNQMMLQ